MKPMILKLQQAYNESPVFHNFQSLFIKFPLLPKPLEEIALVTDRVAHHTVTNRLLVAAWHRQLAPHRKDEFALVS